jgi:hypothetical protein
MKGDGKKSRASESTLVIRCHPDDVEFTREGHIVIKDRSLSAGLRRRIRAIDVPAGRHRAGAKTRMPPGGDPPPLKNQHCRAARRVSATAGSSRAASKKRVPPGGDPPPLKNQHCRAIRKPAPGTKGTAGPRKKRMPPGGDPPPLKNQHC